MAPNSPASFIAFCAQRRIASGSLEEVSAAAQAHIAADPGAHGVLVFDNSTGAQVDMDWQGTPFEVAARARAALPSSAAQPAPESAGAGTEPGQRGRGRPRLGVVAREITLLPRHWDWLATQPGGASVAVRKLVEAARKTHEGHDTLRRQQEVVLRFATAMAGNEPGFEEAMRALYAGNGRHFDALLQAWPADVADHVRVLARGCFAVFVAGPGAAA